MNELSTELKHTQSVSIFEDANAFEFANRMAIPLSKSTMVPVAYQGSVSNCIVALEMSQRLGESVLMVMQNTSIIHGKPGLDAKFMIALVNSKAGFAEPLEFEFSGQGDDWSCFAYTTRKNGKVVKGASVSVKMAKSEGWWDKKGSKWPTMTELMLQYRAGAFFSRVHCPEVSMGMHTQDELTDIGYVETETISKTVVDDLNAKIKNKDLDSESYDFEEISQDQVNDIETESEIVSDPEPETPPIVERIEDDDF